MVNKKNILLTVGVTGLLIAALFVLFPSSASAAEITGVNVFGVTDAGTTGTADNADSFTLSTQVTIPAGEHIPLNWAQVQVFKAGTAAVGGILSTAVPANLVCDTETTVGASAVVTSVTGDTATIDTFGGQGYTYTGTDNGYGYNYGYGWNTATSSEKFAGYGPVSGYGYGYAGGDIVVTVQITVTGCYDEIHSALSGDAFKQFRVQVKVGGDATYSITSLPATATFVDIFSTGGTPVAVPSPEGFQVAAGPYAAGDLVDVTIPGAGPFKKIKFNAPAGGLPVGTTMAFKQHTSTGGAGAAYGVSGLGTQFSGKAMQFQLELQMPGQAAKTDLGFPVTLTIQVDPSFLNAMTEPNFRVWAYDGAGNAKGAGQHPSVTYLSSEPAKTFEVVISHFSSYAAGGTTAAPPASSSGGGGAAVPTTTTTTTTVTPTSTTTTTGTVTSTQVVDGPDSSSSSTGNKGTPGLTVALLAIALAGAAIVVRRRV